MLPELAAAAAAANGDTVAFAKDANDGVEAGVEVFGRSSFALGASSVFLSVVALMPPNPKLLKPPKVGCYMRSSFS